MRFTEKDVERISASREFGKGRDVADVNQFKGTRAKPHEKHSKEKGYKGKNRDPEEVTHNEKEEGELRIGSGEVTCLKGRLERVKARRG